MTLRAGVAEQLHSQAWASRGSPGPGWGWGFSLLGLRFSPFKKVLVLGTIEGCLLVIGIPCALPTVLPAYSALGEAGGQKPAWSVRMLHFLFLTGPGFRGH